MSQDLCILFVDDDPNDQLLVRTALKHFGLKPSLQVVRDGEQAIAYLTGAEGFEDRQQFPFPNVLLTDLKMPGMNGFELLQWLRDHPQYSLTPIIVLTSSRIESDVRHAYELGANSFMVKPQGLKQLVELIRITYEYWSRCERLPAGQR